MTLAERRRQLQAQAHPTGSVTPKLISYSAPRPGLVSAPRKPLAPKPQTNSQLNGVKIESTGDGSGRLLAFKDGISPNEPVTFVLGLWNEDGVSDHSDDPHPGELTATVQGCWGSSTAYELGSFVTHSPPNGPITFATVTLPFPTDDCSTFNPPNVTVNTGFFFTLTDTDGSGGTGGDAEDLSGTGGLPTQALVGSACANSSSGHAKAADYRCAAVNTDTGAFDPVFPDASFSGPGGGLDLQHSYSSADSTPGLLGPGWKTPWDASLAAQPNGDVVFHAEDGSQYTYKSNGSGSFSTPTDAASTLKTTTAGYTLVTPTQEALSFDTAGRLASESDRVGKGLTFSYGAGGLSSVSDAGGHTATLSYTGTHVSSVAFSDGRSVAFGYTGGELSSVTEPDGGTSGYGYDSAGRLVTVTDPLGHSVTNTYDAAGRVHTQSDATGALTTFSYLSSGESDVTDPNGGIWTDQYYGNALHASYDPLGNATTYGYDGYWNQSAVTDPLGNTTTSTYDTKGRMLTRAGPGGAGAESWTYDTSGNLATSVDANAGTTTYGYNAQNELTSAKDPVGNTSTLTYNALGKPDTATTAAGQSTHYGYDAAGDVTSVTTPLGAETSYTYNSAGQVLTQTDPRGNATGASPAAFTTTSTYDADGRLLTQTSPLGGTTHYGYDAAGDTKTVTDPAGHTTTYGYDQAGRPTTVTDAAGHATTSIYDGDGNLLSVTDPNGAETSYTYDKANRRTTSTTARGNVAGASAAAYTWTTGYDQAGEATSVTDPLGHATLTAYDALGRVTKTTDPLGHATSTAYDGDSNTLSVTDALGEVTATAYDADNRPTKATDPLGNATTTTYTADGQVASTTSPLGEKTTYGYDADGRQTSVVDPLGNATGATASAHTWTTGYDLAGNATSTTDPLGHTTRTSYDADNNTTTVATPGGGSTRYQFDDLDRLTTVTAPDGGTTSYTYDNVDNTASSTDANLHTTTYTYDADNRLATQTKPLSRTSTYGYDPDGDLTTTKDARGLTTTNTYDPTGSLTGTTYSDTTPAVSYTYDGADRLTAVTDATGTRNLAYDNADHLKTVSVPGATTTFSYTYNTAGAVTGRTYPDGDTTTYGFDADGRQTSQTASGATTGYTYDADGNLTRTTLPSTNGYTESRTYDAADELTKISSTKGAATLASWQLALNPDGQPTTVTPTRAGLTSTPQSYSYDASGRLRSECTSATGTTGCPAGSAKTTYTYDLVGNRLTSNNGTATNYSYDAADELTQTVTGSTTTTYTYDADGNQTGAGTATFTYNAANELDSANDGTQYLYVYDAEGDRTDTDTVIPGIGHLPPVAAHTRGTAWDINNPLPQAATDENGNYQPVADYHYDPTGTIQSTHQASGSYYYHHDWLGSVTDLTDSTGTDQDRYTYSAFGITGTTALVSSPPSNNFTYTGQYNEPSTTTAGLYLRARNYNPALGRFTSQDPAAASPTDPASSAYAYTDDQPTTLTDPSGACPLCVAAIGGVIGAVVGGGIYTWQHRNGGFTWGGFGTSAGKGALIGAGAGLLIPATGGAAATLLGLEGTDAVVGSAIVNGGVGAIYTGAVNGLQCQSTSPQDYLVAALGGALPDLASLAGRSATNLWAPRITVHAYDDYKWAPAVADTSVLPAGLGWEPSQGTPLIGRVEPDTKLALPWKGYAVLNVPDPPGWSLEINDAWIQTIIDQRGEVYTGSPTEGNYWNAQEGTPSVFAREVQQLLQAGYSWHGDYLIPPR